MSCCQYVLQARKGPLYGQNVGAMRLEMPIHDMAILSSGSDGSSRRA